MFEGKTINISELADNVNYDIMSDCLNLGMRVYFFNNIYSRSNYFHVSNAEQTYFAIYCLYEHPTYASTFSQHNPNRGTGSSYRVFTEDAQVTRSTNASLVSKITAQEVLATLMQSELNVMSGKEKKVPMSVVLWSDSHVEVVKA